MSVGSLVRKILGKRMFSVAGHYYRSVFVDLEKVAQSMQSHIKQNARILDIGGGDGAPLNYLLKLRPDITVTMIDLSKSIGSAISEDFLPRVSRLPDTSVRQWLEKGEVQADCVIISDVIHHIPRDMRSSFFKDLGELLSKSGATLIIKDIEPGYFRSYLSLWADTYISGDKSVTLVSREDVEQLVSEGVGASRQVRKLETDLFKMDRPNYALIFTP